MRTKNNILLMAIFLAMAVLYPGIDSQAAEPAELVTLRQEFTAQKKGVVEEELRSEIFDDYIDKLIELESDLRLNRRDMQGVNAVRHEMRAVKKELASPQTSEPIPPLYDLAAAEAIVKKAAEEAARKAAVEAAAEVAAKKAAEETARKAAAEAAAKKAAEEATRKAAAEVAAKEAAEESARKAAAEAAAKKAAEESARKAAAEVAATKAAEESARKAAAEAAAKQAAEEVARKAAAEVAAKKAAEEAAREAAAKKATAEAARKAAAKKTAEAARKAVAVAAAVVAAPKPAVVAKPAASKRSGKSHVSNVQGQAAAADFSKNNVYEFDLSRVGKVSTLTFYATGRSNIDSDGKIWLITPDGRREKIGAWEISNVSTIGASSYKDLKAIKHDISKLVTNPGTYKVEFEWTSGLGPLYIYRVELTS